MWIPGNKLDGLSEDEYIALLDGLNKSDYYCKKLNKSALYVSGPTFNSEAFDNIATKCKFYGETNDTKIIVNAVIHELSTSGGNDNTPYEPPILEEQEMKAFSLHDMELQHTRRQSFASDELLWKYKNEPRRVSIFGAIANKSKDLSNSNHSFGIIFIEHQMLSPKNDTIALPSLEIMKRLHHQLWSGNVLYNIEIFGFDDCYNDLDLIVSRKFRWKSAIWLLIQLLFLPIFVLIPLTWILQKLCRISLVSVFNPNHI